MPKLKWEDRCDFKDLTFGVEIETSWGERDHRSEWDHRSGWDRPSREHMNDLFYNAGLEGWITVEDGSINGWEFVSPVLEYPKDFDQIEKVCTIVRDEGLTVDYHCGIHVHVGFPNDVKALRRLLRNVGAIEDVIYTLARGEDSEHRGTGYCHPIHDFVSYCSNFEDLIKPVNSVRRLGIKWYGSESEMEYGRSYKYNGTRYNGCNLHSFWFRGTIEFRYFNGTLNPTVIRSWVVLCLKLVARSIGAKGSMNNQDRWNPQRWGDTSNWSCFRSLLVNILGFSKIQLGYFSYIKSRLLESHRSWDRAKGISF